MNFTSRVLASLLILFALAGCGADAYSSEVEGFRDSLKSYNGRVREGVQSSSNASVSLEIAYRVTSADRVISLDSDEAGSAEPGKPAQTVELGVFTDNASVFSELPSDWLTETDATTLQNALSALDEFADLIGKLAGLEDAEQVTDKDLERLKALFDNSSEFLSDTNVAHPGFFKAPKLKGHATKLSSWFTKGSSVLETLANLVAAGKRRKAIKEALENGVPLLEKMCTNLEELLFSLREVEEKALSDHSLYLSELLEENANKANLALSFSDEYLIKAELFRLARRREELESIKEADQESFTELKTKLQELKLKTGMK